MSGELRDFNRSTLAVDPGRRLTPAAEWLLDNFYLIEEQIRSPGALAARLQP